MKNKNERGTVCATVVTYNRKELLLECLDALTRQTYPVDAMYIIDNFSDDGTAELLLEKKYINELPPSNPNEPWEKEFTIKSPIDHKDIKVYFVRMSENTGGAGGFYEGVKRGYERGYDWVWLMDDDVEPFPDSLENLLYHVPELENVGFLSSVVRGIDKITSLNMPSIDSRPSENGYENWDKYLNLGIIKIKTATFVSCLVNKTAIGQVGFPIKEMFIWGDDTEYTDRITDFGYYGYFIGNSRVIHKRHNQKSISIFNENDESRIKMYYYFYRNHGYMKLKKGYKSFAKHILNTSVFMVKIFLKSNENKFLKMKTILRGTWDAVWFEKYIKS